jgi:hypothetical protein
MLGSVAEADDALQEAWLRVRDQDPDAVENMPAWLTTVVGRVCLNMLRAVVLRIDGGRLRRSASRILHGAEAVARHTSTYSKLYPYVVPAVVNGAAGAVIAPRGERYAVMAFIVRHPKIAAIDALLDPERLERLKP